MLDIKDLQIGASVLSTTGFDIPEQLVIITREFEKKRKEQAIPTIGTSMKERKILTFLHALALAESTGEKDVRSSIAETFFYGDKDLNIPGLHIISMKDTTSSFWDTQRQIYRDNGMGDILSIESDFEESVISQAQTIQKGTRDDWYEYMSHPDCPHPLWMIPFVVQGLQKMGVRTKTGFVKRDKETVAPYPRLDAGALARVRNKILEAYTNPEDGSLIVRTGFANLYVQEILKEHNIIQLPSDPKKIKGRWIEYKPEEGEAVAKAAEGTGWCINDKRTAEYYMSYGGYSNSECVIKPDSKGRFFLFHIYDPETGKLSSNAFVSIRLGTDGRVAEVSGRLDGQEIETELIPILEEKIKTMPGGEAFQEKIDVKKRLIDIDKRWLHEKELPEGAIPLRKDTRITQEDYEYILRDDLPTLDTYHKIDPRLVEFRKTIIPIMNGQSPDEVFQALNIEEKMNYGFALIRNGATAETVFPSLTQISVHEAEILVKEHNISVNDTIKKLPRQDINDEITKIIALHPDADILVPELTPQTIHKVFRSIVELPNGLEQILLRENDVKLTMKEGQFLLKHGYIDADTLVHSLAPREAFLFFEELRLQGAKEETLLARIRPTIKEARILLRKQKIDINAIVRAMDPHQVKKNYVELYRYGAFAETILSNYYDVTIEDTKLFIKKYNLPAKNAFQWIPKQNVGIEEFRTMVNEYGMESEWAYQRIKKDKATGHFQELIETHGISSSVLLQDHHPDMADVRFLVRELGLSADTVVTYMKKSDVYQENIDGNKYNLTELVRLGANIRTIGKAFGEGLHFRDIPELCQVYKQPVNDVIFYIPMSEIREELAKSEDALPSPRNPKWPIPSHKLILSKLAGSHNSIPLSTIPALLHGGYKTKEIVEKVKFLDWDTFSLIAQRGAYDANLSYKKLKKNQEYFNVNQLLRFGIKPIDIVQRNSKKYGHINSSDIKDIHEYLRRRKNVPEIAESIPFIMDKAIQRMPLKTVTGYMNILVDLPLVSIESIKKACQKAIENKQIEIPYFDSMIEKYPETSDILFSLMEAQKDNRIRGNVGLFIHVLGLTNFLEKIRHYPYLSKTEFTFEDVYKCIQYCKERRNYNMETVIQQLEQHINSKIFYGNVQQLLEFGFSPTEIAESQDSITVDDYIALTKVVPKEEIKCKISIKFGELRKLYEAGMPMEECISYYNNKKNAKSKDENSQILSDMIVAWEANQKEGDGKTYQEIVFSHIDFGKHLNLKEILQYMTPKQFLQAFQLQKQKFTYTQNDKFVFSDWEDWPIIMQFVANIGPSILNMCVFPKDRIANHAITFLDLGMSAREIMSSVIQDAKYASFQYFFMEEAKAIIQKDPSEKESAIKYAWKNTQKQIGYIKGNVAWFLENGISAKEIFDTIKDKKYDKPRFSAGQDTKTLLTEQDIIALVDAGCSVKDMVQFLSKFDQVDMFGNRVRDDDEEYKKQSHYISFRLFKFLWAKDPTILQDARIAISPYDRQRHANEIHQLGFWDDYKKARARNYHENRRWDASLKELSTLEVTILQDGIESPNIQEEKEKIIQILEKIKKMNIETENTKPPRMEEPDTDFEDIDAPPKKISLRERWQYEKEKEQYKEVKNNICLLPLLGFSVESVLPMIRYFANLNKDNRRNSAKRILTAYPELASTPNEIIGYDIKDISVEEMLQIGIQPKDIVALRAYGYQSYREIVKADPTLKDKAVKKIGNLSECIGFLLHDGVSPEVLQSQMNNLTMNDIRTIGLFAPSILPMVAEKISSSELRGNVKELVQCWNIDAKIIANKITTNSINIRDASFLVRECGIDRKSVNFEDGIQLENSRYDFDDWKEMVQDTFLIFDYTPKTIVTLLSVDVGKYDGLSWTIRDVLKECPETVETLISSAGGILPFYEEIKAIGEQYNRSISLHTTLSSLPHFGPDIADHMPRLVSMLYQENRFRSYSNVLQPLCEGIGKNEELVCQLADILATKRQEYGKYDTRNYDNIEGFVMNGISYLVRTPTFGEKAVVTYIQHFPREKDDNHPVIELMEKLAQNHFQDSIANAYFPGIIDIAIKGQHLHHEFSYNHIPQENIKEMCCWFGTSKNAMIELCSYLQEHGTQKSDTTFEEKTESDICVEYIIRTPSFDHDIAEKIVETGLATKDEVPQIMDKYHISLPKIKTKLSQQQQTDEFQVWVQDQIQCVLETKDTKLSQSCPKGKESKPGFDI